MSQFASDSFTGADGTALQTYSADWTRHVSYSVNSIISGNRAACLSGGSSAYLHSGSPASADYSVSCDLYVVAYYPSFAYAGVTGRSSTAANTFYHARHGVAAGWQLYRAVNGAFTLLGSAAASLTAGNTYVLKLDMSGSAIKMWVDGVLTASATDTQITAAGKSGIRFSNNSAILETDGIRVDNFSADEAGAGAHDLTITNASQGNVVSTGTVTQTHALAISSAAQGNSASTGSLVQVHALAIANTTQANLADDVEIGVGVPADLDIADAAQTNTAGTSAITQEHAISGANSTQQNAASTPAISQTHTLAVPNLTQPNTASDGEITGDTVVNLTISASVQPNTAESDGISQTHVLVITASAQENSASTVSVTQIHALTPASATQNNLASDGAVVSYGDLAVADLLQSNTLSGGNVTTIQTLTIASAEQDNRVSSGALIADVVFEAAMAATTAIIQSRIKKPGIPHDTAQWLRTMLEIIVGRRNNKIEVPEQQSLTFSGTPTKAEVESLYAYTNEVRGAIEQLINRLDS